MAFVPLNIGNQKTTPTASFQPLGANPLNGFDQIDQAQQQKAKPFGIVAGENTTSALEGGIGKIIDAQKEANAAPSSNALVNAGRGLESGLGMAAGGFESASAPVAGFVSALLAKIAPQGKSITGQEISNTDSTLVDSIKTLAQAHPEIVKNLSNLFTVATAPLGLEGGLSGGIGKSIVDAVSKEGLNSAKEGIVQSTKDLIAGNQKFDEAIAPKPTNFDNNLITESGQVTPEIADQKAWELIQPKSTPNTNLAYSKGGNVSDQSLMGTGKLIPTVADKPLVETTSRMFQDGTLRDGMSPKESQAAVNQKAAQLNADQKGFLADNDKAVNLTTRDKTGLMDSLQAVRNKSIVPFSKDVTAKGAYDSTIQMFKNELATGKVAGTVKGATTLTRIDKALTNFDQEMEKFGAWEKTSTGDLTDTAKARVMAIRDIHSNARDFIAKELPPNSPWKSIRAEESNLYNISDRIAQRIADTVGKSGIESKVQSAVGNNPLIKAGVGIVKRAIPMGIGTHLIP